MGDEGKEETEYEYVFGESEVIRFKWLADGSKTWDEVIEKLEKRKQYMRELRDNGCELLGEVTDDYLLYRMSDEEREKWRVEGNTYTRVG